MRRALLLALTIIVATIAAPSPAQAAASCSIHTSIVEQANAQTIAGNDIDAYHATQCNQAYRVKLVLQYTDASGWHNATCQAFGIGPPCPVTRPSTGWYAAGSEHDAIIEWAVETPGNICNNHQFRVEQVITFQSGAGGLTFIPSGTGIGC